ncbi:MAG: M48 family metallopeptidase [Bacteroidetes bacterium]|nr:M48 family metallopeptidase [Bacteroidota bacterium]
MSTLFWLIIVFILGEFVLSKYLSRLNSKSWSPEVPEELRGLYDEEKYAKAQAYDKEKTKLGNISSYFSLALLLLMLFFKGFAWLNGWAMSVSSNPILQALLFFGMLAIVSDILSLPFSTYGIFHIEDKYGFNKMTWKTYFSDKIKGLLLSTILGGGLISLIIWFYHSAGPQFWLYAWIAVTAVSLFFAMFYTTLIVPLFNKLTPLEDGSLRNKIEEFAGKVSFPLTNIFVIDGSKRSSKANAYFSGLGSKKSIVLYDTLMKDQTEEELVAILAHEVGHYKRKHVQKSMIISILNTGLMLWLIGIFVGNAAFSNALSVAQPNFHIGILVFTILYSPVSMLTGVLMNMFSRKNEYEADNYAKDHYGPAPLISSLKKLSVSHLSNLQPHPLFVFFNYSHPPLLERIRNLRA